MSHALGRVAELADAQDSGSCEGNLVGVQVPPRPPRLLLVNRRRTGPAGFLETLWGEPEHRRLVMGRTRDDADFLLQIATTFSASRASPAGPPSSKSFAQRPTGTPAIEKWQVVWIADLERPSVDILAGPRGTQFAPNGGLATPDQQVEVAMRIQAHPRDQNGCAAW